MVRRVTALGSLCRPGFELQGEWVRLVKQKDENGCGVACVAMMAGITYAQAHKRIFGERAGGYTNTADLRRALAELGIQTAPRLVRFKEQVPTDLPFNAILKTNRKRKDWHWVVWDCRRQKVLDSRVPPYKRYRHSSYLEIVGSTDAAHRSWSERYERC